MLGALYFLTTQEGRNFNERVFGRYYTAGAILMLGAWGAFFIGVFALGVAATVVARRRRESPAWMPNVALAAGLVAAAFVPALAASMVLGAVVIVVKMAADSVMHRIEHSRVNELSSP
jgi:Kef-type K+ transport system membrane component KefB